MSGFYRHPILVCLALAAAAYVAARSIRQRHGADGLRKARRTCLKVSLTTLVLLILDGFLVAYAKGLNPDGYAMIYPIVLGMLLAPLLVASGLCAGIFQLVLRSEEAAGG